MNKLNHKLLFYIFPYFVVISIILKPNVRKSFSIQYQTQNYKISSSSTASPVLTQTSLKPANTNTDIWGQIGAIGSFVSGVIAILAFIQSSNNKAESESKISSLIDTLTNQTNDPRKKQELLDIKEKFQQKKKEIYEDEIADKEAAKWLEKNIEQLADTALNTVLREQNFSQKDRDNFRSNLVQYLSAIKKDLYIGDYDHMNEKINELSPHHSRDNNIYQDSLDFVINKAMESTLTGKSKEELKLYIEHLIRSII